jgi:hypothetical protein
MTFISTHVVGLTEKWTSYGYVKNENLGIVTEVTQVWLSYVLYTMPYPSFSLIGFVSNSVEEAVADCELKITYGRWECPTNERMKNYPARWNLREIHFPSQN